VKGKFYPLFWKAQIGTAKSFIPLEHVDTFGVQTYRLNNHFVTELTIALKSKTFVRFYHIRQDGVEAVVQDVVRNRGNKNVHVVKEYPVTSHKEMMEYRVAKKEDVDRLMKDFYTTYLDFKMQKFVSEQRENSVKKIDLSKDPADELTEEEKVLEGINEQ